MTHKRTYESLAQILGTLPFCQECGELKAASENPMCCRWERFTPRNNVTLL